MVKNILLTFLVIPFYLVAQKPFGVFKHLTADDGLSSQHANCFLRDKNGFLWIGSNNGIDKYDGYTFKSFQAITGDTTLLLCNNINSLAEDADGNIWVAHDQALQKFDVKRNKWKNFITGSDTALGHGAIRMIIDRQQKVWGMTTKEILFTLDIKTGSIKKYKHDPLNPKSIGPRGVMGLHEDKDGDIWLNTWDYGLTKYNPETEDFTHYLKDSSSNVNPIFTITSDHKGGIWIGGFNEKYPIARFNKFTGKLKRYSTKEIGIDCKILNSTHDQYGNLWFTSLGNGLINFNIKNGKFFNYINLLNDTENVSENNLVCTYVDYENILWTGTVNKGINQLNTSHNSTNFYPINGYINNFNQDEVNTLWVSASTGLFYLDSLKHTFNKLKLGSDNFENQGVAYTINRDKQHIWASSQGSIFDINIFTKKVSIIKSEYFNDDNISRIYEDLQKNVWVFAGLKLYYYPLGDFSKGKKVLSFEYFNGRPNVLIYENKNEINFLIGDKWLSIEKSTHKVKDIFKDKFKGEYFGNLFSIQENGDSILLVTSLGLCKFHLSSLFYKVIKYPFAVANEIIPAGFFLSDSLILVSTFRGNYIYNFINHRVSKPEIYNINKMNFDVISFARKNHKIYQSVGNGVIIFNPFEFENRGTYIPKIALTDFMLFNKHVKIDTVGSPLKEAITNLEYITLTHEQSIFSIEMALLNFDEQDKNKYAYQLKGLENEWNFTGSRRVASYTNLEAGEYIFQYKGCDKNGNWSEIRNFKITVLPPFWKTWWFITLMILVTIGSIYLLIKIRLKIVENQKVELEHQVKLRTAEILHQKEEIMSQQERIFELYHELTDSIVTSKRIQDSILPPENKLKQGFRDAMVYYRPKDIVSGDFYWFHKENEVLYIAAIDCTGHGVSGAFMSLIGYTILNKIVEQQHGLSPKNILDQLNIGLIGALHQESENPVSKDGMDASIIRYNQTTGELQFAGANNPLYLVRNGQIIITKADRNSVGIQPMNKVSEFTNHSLILQKGDVIYLSSDGFMSQFGGETKEEKFKHARFREMLLTNYQLSMDRQLHNIEKTLLEWKSSVLQTDDIMVLGFII